MWLKRSKKEIEKYIFSSLNSNTNYKSKNVLGIPASFLDERVFPSHEKFLQKAAFLQSLIKNPNHIGCHTLGDSESFFKGTQEVEKDLIEICAHEIFKAKEGTIDGYVASGGTEANIQALWIYRNYFLQKLKAKADEIALICSEDSHYSMNKAANLLDISLFQVKVDEKTRLLNQVDFIKSIKRAQSNGIKHFIVVGNMMTTMFGSVDPIEEMIEVLVKLKLSFKFHIDAAYGGFYFPFVHENSKINFSNPYINSFTLDAHKMAQAPYGTGIFLIRKNYIHHANTKSARYVKGEDCTLIGSRSGANAIAVWMILNTYGKVDWTKKMFKLKERTDWLEKKLIAFGIIFFRYSKSNIITLKAESLNEKIAAEFGLVPDNHLKAKWYKIVVMEHVTKQKLKVFLSKLSPNELET